MQLSIIRADDSITHLVLEGRLDVQGVNHIHDKFVFHTASRRKSTLVDVSGVTFIASLGIGMLVSAAKALQRQGAKMVLLGPTDMVQRTLEAAGIEHVIPIVHAEENALQLLG